MLTYRLIFAAASQRYLSSVAQIANLPYRRMQIGRALAVFRRPGQGAVLQDGILRYSRLAVCATNTTEALNRYSQRRLRGFIAFLAMLLGPVHAPQAADGDWPVYLGDKASTH